MMTVDEATQTLAALNGKLADARLVLAEIDDRRQKLAYPAMTGDADAKKVLDKLNRDRAVHTADIESIDTAIAKARRDVGEAEAAAAREAQKERAREWLARARILEECVAKGEKALRAIAEVGETIEDVLGELNYELGLQYPNIAGFRAVADRPVDAALMFAPSGKALGNGQPKPGIFKRRHLAPGERTTLSEIVDGMVKTIRRS